MLSHGVAASTQPTLAVFTVPLADAGRLQSMIVIGVPVKTCVVPSSPPIRTS